MTKSPTILIMAGGTGGHIFPGLAVADYLKAQGWQVHWLGTPTRMEANVVPKYGYDISFINIEGVRGKGVASLLHAPLKIIKSVQQSLAVIDQVKPDVVLGMGGYASGPGGVAARIRSIPLVLHEQNAAAGLTNRLLAKIATKVLAAFPGAFASKMTVEVVGNPVRADILALNQTPSQSPQRRVLVVGGSLGAQALNETVPAAIAQLNSQPLQIWHQTGAGKQDAVLAAYNKLAIDPQTVQVSEFIDDMAEAYRWADVVICRSGALTVSELALAGKPAIFVPLPHAVDDHQTKNAMFLVAAGAAKLLPQSQLTPTNMAQQLLGMFSSEHNLSNMSKASRAAARPNATEQVSKICQSLVHV
ncbi:undecaprenyldiphospho-muramoylpentapeptide beta-N-acetylglucosaminyltransferase [Thalassotalea mangrovi]|uniref:UDP-N-acetylglucosamine--N-acetylmuramyl-(pentapeptide) pyrophosphoryl-undecaprenol N-acetylglucosamine transferase n=1 Tax=Thalassotalea mangrovi TaxID=2572245 RepID=A0A4U1BAG1_9GAMM|nr:undecaprenyldiphospho-muramoylpentapeptide beta-N-acetylglucosaminyltransferase [Thalassotalea mangrovi]TKB47676.1 undecaprenyldiphospho-muramoylpentapeptide beta-N-acetylglucosaminyltransferase [Thalassotalea mangrovi]